MINETKTMLHEHDKSKFPTYSSEQVKKTLENGRISKDELNKIIEKLTAKYKTALKELAKK